MQTEEIPRQEHAVGQITKYWKKNYWRKQDHHTLFAEVFEAIQENVSIYYSFTLYGLQVHLRQKAYGLHLLLARDGRFTELDYLLLGLVSALPSFLLPFVLVGKGDKSKHWFERYWAKASLWIIIFSYVGNYFWTHYFFAVLGASYTFPSWRMNNVPHTTFLLTHACFLFYHVASNITLRRVRHAISDLSSHVRWAIQAIWILTLSYIIALLETYAIANFPYYDFVDRAAMYKVGCLFYAIYFIVSFPMFIRLDEKPNDPWSLSRTAIDSLAAAMIVTIILDLWRLYLGPIVEIPTSIPYKECLSYGLPWMS